MPELPPVDLAGIAAGFANLLHAAGLAVAPDRAGRWAAAVRLARPATTDELYWLGRVTLTLDPGEIAVYDAVFSSVFRGLTDVADARGDVNAAPIPWVDTARNRAATDRAAELDGRRGGAPRPSPWAATRDAPDDLAGRETASPAPATADEVLRHRDFADCTPEELAQLRRIVAAMQVSPPMRASRRHWRHHHGRAVDRRDTMRQARRTGGQPFALRMRRPTERRRRVVLIADVSGSMEAYSRAYLYLLHGSVKALRAETFVFATGLTRLTRRLAVSSADPEQVLRAAVADVEDWAGGTRIGASLRVFNDRWGRRGVARGAVIVIVSDGWESGDPAELREQMARLRRMAYRVVWVNPRAKSADYQPLVAGMAAVLPFVDHFTSGHSADALDDVIRAISVTGRATR